MIALLKVHVGGSISETGWPFKHSVSASIITVSFWILCSTYFLDIPEHKFTCHPLLGRGVINFVCVAMFGLVESFEVGNPET